MKREGVFLPFIGLVLLSPASLDATSIPLAPPGSLEPRELVAAVRVSHRHRAIVECIRVPKRASCVGRVAEADTGAIVRFERTGVVTVGLTPAPGAVRVVFPHHAGPQEQVVRLGVGPWLVDWRESERLERLEIEPGTRMQVALATTSGACEYKHDTCELLPGVRERRIRISEAP